MQGNEAGIPAKLKTTLTATHLKLICHKISLKHALQSQPACNARDPQCKRRKRHFCFHLRDRGPGAPTISSARPTTSVRLPQGLSEKYISLRRP